MYAHVHNRIVVRVAARAGAVAAFFIYYLFFDARVWRALPAPLSKHAPDISPYFFFASTASTVFQLE